MATQHERVFDAVLKQEVPWRRLAASTLCALFLLCALLGAVASGARDALRERKPHVEAVVTFLDLPQPVDTDSVHDGVSMSPGGVAGKSNEQLSYSENVNRARTTPSSQKPERAAVLTDSAKRSVADEAAREAVATPAPIEQGGGRANEGPAATQASAQSGGGSPQSIGNGSSAGVGSSGLGAANGAGMGTGTGSQAEGSGRFGVLPFMDGMTRPVLQFKVDPTYTHEAMDARVAGVALLKCVLGADGSVRQCRIVKGLPFMNDALLAAVSRWRYSPVVYQGRAVAVEYLITLHLTPP